MARYVVRGGVAGVERHRLLAQCLWPTTQTLLRRARLRRGMRCLDVGCGLGDVTLRMAQWVGPAGHAVGLDSDAAFLAAARQEATQRQLPALFRQGRAEDLDDEAAYDLVYTRGLLTHVADPAGVVERMVRAACPGGSIVAEEPYFRARVCYPASPAFERCGELMQAAVQYHGGDPNIGPRVLGFFLDSGVQQVQLTGVLPLFYELPVGHIFCFRGTGAMMGMDSPP